MNFINFWLSILIWLGLRNFSKDSIFLIKLLRTWLARKNEDNFVEMFIERWIEAISFY